MLGSALLEKGRHVAREPLGILDEHEVAATGIFDQPATPQPGHERSQRVDHRLVIGGPGNDRVDGGPRRDVCQGERVRDCETRI